GPAAASRPRILWLADVRLKDIKDVGGKNASLGEMMGALHNEGIRLPHGFAITAAAYWDFLDANNLRGFITATLADYHHGRLPLAATGRMIRAKIGRARFPRPLEKDILAAYARLRRMAGGAAVAVRSSATAEDLPEASFAGQHESFLNIKGGPALLRACRSCFASLFNDRAIVYRERNGFADMKVALSIGVQQMVRSDRGSAGVMFTLDPESGFPRIVRIEGAWGLGELVVKGQVTPDSYTVFKPLLGRRDLTPIIEKSRGGALHKMVYGATGAHPTRVVATTQKERKTHVLTDADVISLARWAVAIEAHYGKPMDIEWAKDGRSGKLYLVQARPETVQSQRHDHGLRTYRLRAAGKPLLSGLAVGSAVATGKVCRLRDPRDIERFPDGAILVATHTDPDWVPVMRRAAAIVTEQGGRTSHAAIVSREFGIPAVIGVGGIGRALKEGQTITVSTCEGDEGHIYAGKVAYTSRVLDSGHASRTRTQIMLNLANPAAALRWWRLPAAGIGLARMEFIIANEIKIHPLALSRFDALKDKTARAEIEHLTAGEDKAGYFVDRLARGVARLAALVYPKPAIVRMSDFKTNEYAALVGGRQFEPVEENPMIGWRGASRYYSPDYSDGFALECRAVAKARSVLGFDNIVVMIPFCRTPEEADKVLKVMAAHGLKRGRDGLQVYVMCEIPSNIIQAEDFARRFDGFSIGSNDLTQLTLGVDRDSRRLSPLFKEDNAAVLSSIRHVIRAAHKMGCKVGFCGQAPSDKPAYARFLATAGIDSISVTPDSFLAVKKNVAAAEARKA
ncbi:MAG: phosphoenolpyruvate synthase, partial [Rhodospirillaceae bacterium]